jgi:hypothetical protein
MDQCLRHNATSNDSTISGRGEESYFVSAPVLKNADLFTTCSTGCAVLTSDNFVDIEFRVAGKEQTKESRLDLRVYDYRKF